MLQQNKNRIGSLASWSKGFVIGCYVSRRVDKRTNGQKISLFYRTASPNEAVVKKKKVNIPDEIARRHVCARVCIPFIKNGNPERRSLE